jgi:hypothetical protein
MCSLNYLTVLLLWMLGAVVLFTLVCPGAAEMVARGLRREAIWMREFKKGVVHFWKWNRQEWRRAGEVANAE